MATSEQISFSHLVDSDKESEEDSNPLQVRLDHFIGWQPEPLQPEDLQERIREEFEGFTWDYDEISRKNGETMPIPRNHRMVSGLVESHALEKLHDLVDGLEIDLLEADHSQQYPDATFTGPQLAAERIALDVKTKQRKPNNPSELKSGGVSIGSYDGYFRQPFTKTSKTKFAYESYDEHWVLAFLYTFTPTKAERYDDVDMVQNIDVVLGEKWKLASRGTASGNTSYMGSVTDVRQLKNHDGVFESREEFCDYWRHYEPEE